MKNAADIRARCEALIKNGLVYVQLVVPSRTVSRRWRSNNRRIWPGGPRGTWIGEVRPGQWLVDVKADDVLKALDKLERRSA